METAKLHLIAREGENSKLVGTVVSELYCDTRGNAYLTSPEWKGVRAVGIMENYYVLGFFCTPGCAIRKRHEQILEGLKK